jgi:sialate O-acetylesterase
MKKIQLSFTAALIIVLSAIVHADVRLPSLMGDNMVLQQNENVRIWGRAKPGEKVSVMPSWQESETSVAADDNGNWGLFVKTPKAGGPYQITIKGSNTIILKNVLAGEVWVCSGQSNMAMPLQYVDQWNKGAVNWSKEVADSNYPNIRLFSVPPDASPVPKDDCVGKWVKCEPNTVGGFSAVAYFYGRELHKQLGIPIGLIHNSFGGTPAESWISREVLEKKFGALLERQRTQLIADKASYQKQLETWQAKTQAAKAQGKPAKPKPEEPYWFRDSWKPAWLYNAMINPLTPYTIKGAIWYQGESNADRAYQYRQLFPAMIQNWRDKWGIKDFPFYYVQLANFQAPAPEPVDDQWAELREAQFTTLSALKNVGMAAAIDVGEANNIHPQRKQEVGKRLALWALAKNYGRTDLVFSSPLYKSIKVENGAIRVYFDHVDGGLVAANGPLKTFAIAGNDHKYVWANARIEGDTVVVYSEKIKNPIAVRYAWAINPEGCNLYNKAGLPASPFRSDCWPGVTINKN